MESYYKTKNIFKLIVKWKWHLLVLVVGACALAVLLSSTWFIKPKYKSTATVYPANINCLSEESESEQMLEMIQSTDIKFRIIDSFELYDHYGVGKDDSNSKDKILKLYNGNVSVQKTPNEAIIISVAVSIKLS
jgi:capsular polysaccharide biosynthesis protein